MAKKPAKPSYKQLEKRLDEIREMYNVERDGRISAEASLKDSRDHFADLKERLHYAEVENARMRGYLARVHDADIARDGLVVNEDADGKRSVPKWPPPLQMMWAEPYAGAAAAFNNGVGQKKRTHWTSY